MSVERNDEKLRDEDLDETLRRLLEPSPHAVERLVRRAMTEGESSRERHRPMRWAVPAIATVASVMVAIVLLILLVPPPDVETPAVDPRPETPPVREAARLTISNAEGVVTVTSASGSTWILLPGDDAS